MDIHGSRIIRCFGVLFGAAAMTVLAQSNASTMESGADSTRNKTSMSKTKGGGDSTFVQEAGVGGLAEVEMGRLAVQKAKDDRIRQFGQKMIDDHSKANEELKQAAAQEGLTVPSSLDEKHRQTISRLDKLSGPQFDAAYAKEMVRDHKEDVKVFEKQSKAGTSAVQKFASDTLPTLKNHLQMAEDLGSVSAASPSSAH